MGFVVGAGGAGGFGGGALGVVPVAGGGSGVDGGFVVPGRGGFLPGGVAGVVGAAVVAASGGGTTGSAVEPSGAIAMPVAPVAPDPPSGASAGGTSGWDGPPAPGVSLPGRALSAPAVLTLALPAPAPRCGPSLSTAAAPATRHRGMMAHKIRRLPGDPTLTRGDDAVNGADVTFAGRAYAGLEPASLGDRAVPPWLGRDPRDGSAPTGEGTLGAVIAAPSSARCASDGDDGAGPRRTLTPHAYAS